MEQYTFVMLVPLGHGQYQAYTTKLLHVSTNDLRAAVEATNDYGEVQHILAGHVQYAESETRHECPIEYVVY